MARKNSKQKIKEPKGGGKGFLVIILIATVLILAGMFFLNDIILAIRLFELENFLREINREAANVDTLNMVTKYKLQLQLYRDKITEEDFNKEEMNTHYLVTEYENQKISSLGTYKDISKPVIYVINLLRYFMDKPPISDTSINPVNTQLAVAYYHERNKNYKKALEVYNLYLEQDTITHDKLPLVKLHEGYCYSIISEYDKAVDIFKGIMRDYSEEDVAITAALLLQYLETILKEIDVVKKSRSNAIEKSEKLYRLMAYDEAEKEVNNFSPDNAEEKEQLKFIKARIYEEKGEKEKSVQIYQEIIEDDHESESAKLANRRILLISTTSEEAEDLKELTQLNNALIEDGDFVELMETTNKIIKAQEETKLLENVKRVEEIVDAEKLEAQSTETLTQLTEGTELVNKEPGTDEEPQQALREIIQASREKIIDIIEEVKPDIIEAVNKSDFKTILEASTPKPTEVPTASPTAVPTVVPTARPTFPPTPAPTIRITPAPTPVVTRAPQASPTVHIKKEPYEVIHKNEKGNIYKVEHYNENDQLLFYYEYEYDENGKPLRVHAYDAQGNFLEEY